MKTVVIGATGHIGTYLVPRLVAAGHEVVAVSRGQRAPYSGGPQWAAVEQVSLNRAELEAQGAFGEAIADLEPDVVIDLICFEPDSCVQLVEALESKVQHFLHCGTIWVYGKSEVVPTVETAPRRPLEDYGRKKAAIAAYLLGKARKDGFPATVLHAGHIVGPGWSPVNPAGNLNLTVFEQLAAGDEVFLPDQGLATLHHVHADDVAQGFVKAMASWGTAVGESFHVVSPQAVTLYGYAVAVARWFGREANLSYLPWDEWKQTVSEDDAAATWAHISHSPNASIAKAKRLLDYRPRYSSLQGIREAVDWLCEHGKIQIEGPRDG